MPKTEDEAVERGMEARGLLYGGRVHGIVAIVVRLGFKVLGFGFRV